MKAFIAAAEATVEGAQGWAWSQATTTTPPRAAKPPPLWSATARCHLARCRRHRPGRHRRRRGQRRQRARLLLRPDELAPDNMGSSLVMDLSTWSSSSATTCAMAPLPAARVETVCLRNVALVLRQRRQRSQSNHRHRGDLGRVLKVWEDINAGNIDVEALLQ